MDLCFDPCFVMTQDAYVDAAVNERKARPVGIILNKSSTLAQDHQSPIDVHAVSPDFGCRPISPMSDSECSESSQATEDTTTSRIIGFGRKRHSVLPTVRPSDDIAPSKIVGFGRKHHHHHRHSICVVPSSFIVPNRKQENRRSLPVLPRDGPFFLADPKRKFEYRGSLDVGSTKPPAIETSSDKRPSRTARRVSGNILGASRQPPKLLLLPQQVQAQQVQAASCAPPGCVKRCLVSVASSLPVEFIVSHFAAVRRLRLKRLNLGRPADGKNTNRGKDATKGLLRRLRKLYRRLRGL